MKTADPPPPKAAFPLPEGLELRVEHVPIFKLKTNDRNARTHSDKQVAMLASSIQALGFNVPLAVTDDYVLLAGHGRLAAAKHLRMKTLPVIRLSHLSEAQQRAFVVADNRLAELAGWDEALLAQEIIDLASLDLHFEIEVTGFDGADLGRLLDFETEEVPDADDECVGPKETAVTQMGDIWICGAHRIVNGDARQPEAYESLMQGEEARMVFTDPPYNVKINGHAGGKGRAKRREFAMASGEMSPAEFRAFLSESLSAMAAACQDGAIAFVCMDWGHITDLFQIGAEIFSETKNLIVWDKGVGGMGSMYRSQHELIAVFKKGKSKHINSFGLGNGGRYRTNVWAYRGVNSFGRGRDVALAMHPTVKPVALVADAIRDVSRPHDIVLDPFGGSGTTMIAAERVKRRARLFDYDPLYCDVICRRWAAFKGSPAILEETGETFDEVTARRQGGVCHG